MFEQLQKKWKVNSLQLFLILCTFAIGGSVTGYVGKKIMNLLSITYDWLWILVYIPLITLLWPLAVIAVSIPFGQFNFFNSYVKKIGKKMVIRNKTSEVKQEIRLAIFASGSGTNASKIIEHFYNHPFIKVALLASNNNQSGVFEIGKKHHISTILLKKSTFFLENSCINDLKSLNIDFIILAGFLWKIPDILIKEYPQKIVNIHPALLPKYGGKGMYGQLVHEAVIAQKETESGISIHYIDEIYDHGQIIFQARCDVLNDDTPQILAQRIHKLEHQHYPVVIEELVQKPKY